ncbi:hypothetical protein [Microbacterium sp. E-13]|uniref:DUF4190 domain-containing protein n=1 Tax=Microbacterium sp. E-13 TaxID=3404048 RepID=UPI003CEC5668
MTDERMPSPGDPATHAGDPATPAGNPATPAGNLATPAGNLATPPGDLAMPAGDPATPAGDPATPQGRPPGDAVPPADGARPGDALPPADGARPGSTPTVEAPSPDIDLAQDASPLPGAHRGGFRRLPTAPVPVTLETAPAEPGGEFTPDDTSWAPAESAHRGLAGWGLAFAVVGLVVSMFVGWGFPVGLVAVASGIIALRRPLENRAVAVWAIALGALSILYSAGWLVVAALRANVWS